MSAAHSLTLLPYKSVAVALLFTVALGPVGLLYSTFWGGLLMVIVGIIVCNSKLFFPILLLWILCCIWAVGAVELYNKKIFRLNNQGRHDDKKNYSSGF